MEEAGRRSRGGRKDPSWRPQAAFCMRLWFLSLFTFLAMYVVCWPERQNQYIPVAWRYFPLYFQFFFFFFLGSFSVFGVCFRPWFACALAFSLPLCLGRKLAVCWLVFSACRHLFRHSNNQSSVPCNWPPPPPITPSYHSWLGFVWIGRDYV